MWAHATQERFAWYQKWRAGDLVLWDNRCVMHRRDAFDESLRRLMHRTQIVGEPVLAGLSRGVRGARAPLLYRYPAACSSNSSA